MTVRSDLFTHLSSETWKVCFCHSISLVTTASVRLLHVIWWLTHLDVTFPIDRALNINTVCNKLQGITVIFYWWAAMKCKLLKMQQACLEQCCRQSQQTGCGVQIAVLHTMVHISNRSEKVKVLVCAFSFFDKLCNCIESACRCDLVENNYGWVQELWMTFWGMLLLWYIST